MKNAIEMGQITANANEVKANRRKEKALKVLHDSIYPEMLKAANDGDYQIKYSLCADTDRETVMAELIESGYEVSKSGYTLKISWFQQMLDATLVRDK